MSYRRNEFVQMKLPKYALPKVTQYFIMNKCHHSFFLLPSPDKVCSVLQLSISISILVVHASKGCNTPIHFLGKKLFVLVVLRFLTFSPTPNLQVDFLQICSHIYLCVCVPIYHQSSENNFCSIDTLYISIHDTQTYIYISSTH